MIIRYFFQFESSVNSEGIETVELFSEHMTGFESSVNSEGIETLKIYGLCSVCLRAV